MLNILYLYHSTQTFTNTVFEHINALARCSVHRTFFAHQDQTTELKLDWTRFDACGIHYSVRLPFDQISPSTVKALQTFRGLKFVFIQDEYDHTCRAWHWIKELGIHLVFTVVPSAGIEKVYPRAEFPETCFVSNLTGYVPDELSHGMDVVPPSQRLLFIGYRGRPLPIRYGKLGIEKVAVGQIVKNYCDHEGIRSDISWAEEDRIYGPGWYEFVASCRSMLGSESGSNVFDWDGTLATRISDCRKLDPDVTDEEVYFKLIQREEIEGIMNQVSPRVFEAIAARTVLVLFEGNYSGILKADEHFIPLKKDGSNLPDVIRKLSDDAYVDAMAQRAYDQVIGSGKYSYDAFVRFVDENINQSFESVCRKRLSEVPVSDLVLAVGDPSPVTTFPIRWQLTLPVAEASEVCEVAEVPETPEVPGTPVRLRRSRLPVFVWGKLPEPVRSRLKPGLKRLLGRD